MDTSTHGRTGPDPAPADGPSATSAEGLRSFWRYTYGSQVGVAVLMAPFFLLVGPVRWPPDPWGTAAWLAAAVVAVAAVRLTDHHIPRTLDTAGLPPRPWRRWAAVGAVASVVVATASLRAGDVLWAVAPALVASLLLASLPPRGRRVATIATIAVATAVGALAAAARVPPGGLELAAGGAFAAAFMLFLTLTTIWVWHVALELDRARRQAAALAVTNERLRFAADLHDIQGHHLQVIALKGELASRLLRRDPEAAAEEMAAVQQLAADALRDTRAVVQGYRRTTLDAEIANARAVLDSAGIEAELHLDVDQATTRLPEPRRHLLGLVVREAVTNVLRHSTATRAELTLAGGDTVRLTVANDGAATTADPGHRGGLRVLADRVHVAGGTLAWHHRDDRFEVRVDLPTAPTGEEVAP